jgi:hypothetical protein
MADWPEWCSWELEWTPHLLKRMVDRQFNEADLRLMLERATGYDLDVVPGRYAIHSRHERVPWDVIVEPIEAEHVLLIITAYPVR